MPVIEHDGLTLIGIAVTDVSDDDSVQLELPFDRAANHALDAALDHVGDRFGSTAVTRAVLLGRERRAAVPRLPD